MSVETTDREKTRVIDAPEAVAVFDTFEAQQAAFHDLRAIGFHHSDIGLRGSREDLEEKLGDAHWSPSGLEDDPRAPRTHFASEEAMGDLRGAFAGGMFFVGSSIVMAAMLTPAGPLAAPIAAVAIGGAPGAVIGTSPARREGEHHKEVYENRIRLGGIPIWVRRPDKDREDPAVKILKGSSAGDVQADGWSN